jgi:hypothetical protein
MKSVNKILIALISSAVVAGGIFVACDNLSKAEIGPNGLRPLTGARKAGDATYGDGDYDFYFKNGKHAGGDCDGYSSDANGKTTIYEYFQSDINDWEKWLKAAGVKPEMYRTSNIKKYCWARFDTSLLAGIGHEGRGSNGGSNDRIDFLLKDGKVFSVKDPHQLHYAWPKQAFRCWIGDEIKAEIVSGQPRTVGGVRTEFDFIMKTASDIQLNRDQSAIVIIFNAGAYNIYNKAVELLQKKETVSILKNGIVTEPNIPFDIKQGRIPYIIADASNITWFAHNL